MEQKILLLIAAALILMPLALAQNQVDLYFFYGKTCPHCRAEGQFLNSIKDKYPTLIVHEFEVSNKENSQLWLKMCEAYGTNPMGVPMTFIDNEYITGYADHMAGDLENRINMCILDSCADPGIKIGMPSEKLNFNIITLQDAIESSKESPIVKNILSANPSIVPNVALEAEYIITWNDSYGIASVYINKTDGQILKVLQGAPVFYQKEENKSIEKKYIHVPVFGDVDPTKIALAPFTFFIAIIDGFNPCTMWILSFLLALLIHVHNRKKIIIVGSVFLFVVYVIYFLFMTAWLNLFLYLGYIDMIRIAIAIIAILAGLINMKDFFWFKKGISLTISDRFKPKLFEKMRNVVKEESLAPVIIGTIVLAAFASIIELPCTSGFPAIYTKILSMQGFRGLSYYLYIMIYCIIYILPLTVIISLFAFFMKGEKMSEKQGRILKFIGGAIMLALGLILLINPNLLMFG